MDKRCSGRLTSALVLSFPLVSVLWVFAGTAGAQDWRSVHEGVEYAEVTKEISGLKVNMNLLRLDLAKVRLEVVHAMDAAIGTEKTSSIAARHGAPAAINAGFFRLDTSIWAGDPVGLFESKKVLLSEATNNRIALFIANGATSTDVSIARLETVEYLESKKLHVLMSGINRERKDNELVRFTPEFGRTTLTNPDGLEVIVSKDRITEINDRVGSSMIPPDGYVLSATGSFRENLLAAIKTGDKVTVLTGPSIDHPGHSLTPEQERTLTAFHQADSAVAGVPQLLHNGNVEITWQAEKSSKSFVETRHPRTAVAKLRDGKFLMITVDGRTESSGGIGLQDLAEYLLSLGATDAMNLDGGGSTTMFLDGKVVNHPSDKEGERKVSDVILVTVRKPVSHR